MWIVRLKPRGAFAPELHSDTLFGCLAWAAASLEGPDTVKKWLTAFEDRDPPFLLSSAFPYRKTDGELTYFLPRPCNWQPKPDMTDVRRHRRSKKYKKLKWVCRETFVQLIRGRAVENVGPAPPSLAPEPILHNRINRLTWGTTEPGLLYYQELTHLSPGAGLYFLLDIRHDDAVELLLAATRLLGHIGWGGNSARGVNHFETTVQEAPADFFPTVNESTHFVTLSLYYPRLEEQGYFAEHVENCWYELRWRRGKIGGRFFTTGHFWKRAVNYFAEGSVFPSLPGWDAGLGWNPVVKEFRDQRMSIRSYGLAFAVPARVTGVAA